MKAAVMSVLLCLLSTLVEVHSQRVPYISFMGRNLPNNSYIDLSQVGDNRNGSNSVQCHTGYRSGDWYSPYGKLLSYSSGEVEVFQSREARRVDLRHRWANISEATPGIYYCLIDTYRDRVIIFVGLYANGGNVALSMDVQFAVDSDLNGNSPQFTFTCISTGGPATNVTWTRDSETVSGGVTVLHNATTAQYTHTLTVAGRLPGQYQCTVSNNKPSQASASFTVKGYRIYFSHDDSDIFTTDVDDGSTNSYLAAGLGSDSYNVIGLGLHVGKSKHFLNKRGSNYYDYPYYTGSDSSSSRKHCAVVSGTLGGFLGGFLIATVLGALLLILVARKLRAEIDAIISLPQVPEEQRSYVPTSSNQAYGCVEGDRDTECVTYDMPSDATIAVQEPVYSTIPI